MVKSVYRRQITMKKRIGVLSLVLLVTAIGALGQARAVTNADLEHYRQQRLDAERDFRENYARLGFPSPEELEKRNERSRVESLEISLKLRTERLEQERLEAARQAAAAQAALYSSFYQNSIRPAEYEEGNFWTYGLYGFPYGRRTRWHAAVTARHQFQPSGYAAGGQFWQIGPRTAPQPLIRVGPRH